MRCKFILDTKHMFFVQKKITKTCFSFIESSTELKANDDNAFLISVEDCKQLHIATNQLHVYTINCNNIFQAFLYFRAIPSDDFVLITFKFLFQATVTTSNIQNYTYR